MRKARLVLILAVAAVVLPCICVSATEILKPKRSIAMLEAGVEPVRVVAFGDSITGVYYHTGSRRAWCDMLGEALQKAYPKAKIQMFNAGISGHTSGQGLARIERDVIARKPHLVLVMFGMNDCTRAKIDVFRKNSVEIVKRLRAAGAEVMLCTPNNVYPNKSRPLARLAEYAQTTRNVAAEMNVPLVDFYKAYEDMQKKNNTDWCLLMSETIHPSMNGHRLFAEKITEKISGKPISLDDVGPPNDSLAFTLKLLRAGKPVKIVAMQPYDKIVPAVLREKFPAAKINVVSWPVAGQSLEDIEVWAKNVRGFKANLIVFAIPGAVAPKTRTEESEETYVRKYTWALALCFGFGPATGDVVPILPSVTNSLDESGQSWEALAKRIIRGYDVKCIQRPEGNTKTARQIVSDWIDTRIAPVDN
ncbi:MAG: GDSL-type esterase/lipase family protein [Planctomycetota bacterium]|nr:GDSL-type esterase/lipase family protein [Planctomycetota bacterium]